MLLERKKYLHELKTQVENTQNGSGGIALVTGEAGIGKTTLLESFQSRIRTELGPEFVLAWGGSDPLFTPRALGPLHDMAHHFSQEITNLIKKNKDPSYLYDALLKFLKESRKKHILFFEDVHWADHATLDLLKFLGRRISVLNCLIILSFRTDEVANNPGLNQLLVALPSHKVKRLELEPLSMDGVKKLAKEKGVEKRADNLYQITGGNPFFVTELLATQKSTQLTVPESVRDAISARLNSLGENEQKLLETISLVPKAVPIKLLKELFKETAEVYAMACVGRGLLTIVDNDSFRFRHELSRLGTLERVSAFEKKRLHAEILHALLKLGLNKEIDLLVHHASGALDAEKVLEYAPLAAEQASVSGSHQEAASHLATALRFIDAASSEQAALLYEAWAYETGLAIGIDDNVIEARRHAVSLWQALDNKVKVGENLRWLSRLFRHIGQAAEADRYADEALAILEDTEPSSERAMAYSLRSQNFMLNDRMPDAILWGNKALELENKFNDVNVRVHALNNIGSAQAFRGNPEGIENLNESLRLSLKNNLHVDAARAYANLAECALKYKNYVLSEEVVAQGIAYCTKHDLNTWIYYLVAFQAQARLLQGKLSEARAIVEGVIQLNDITLLMKLPSLLILSRIYSLANCDSAYEYLKTALNDARATDELQHIVPARIAMIEYAWLQDNPTLAFEQLEELHKLNQHLADPWKIGEFVVWGKRHGFHKEYEYTIELPEPYQLELAGKLPEAADAWEKLGLPYHAALVLANTKNPAQFELFNRSLKLLESIGATALINKVKKNAALLSVATKLNKVKRGPYRAAQAHPFGLTKKEQIVFKLILKGESNRAISEELARSQRTIEHHVASILKKMNVNSRMDAILRAQNEPWLIPQ